jgi:hypothetical protein
MRRFFTPAAAIFLGSGAFLWLQFSLGPRLAGIQSRKPSAKEVQVLADLKAGKIAGQNGPALAQVIDHTNSLLELSYRMQQVLLRVAKLLCAVLFLLGMLDIRTIIGLHRQEYEGASPTRA